MHDQGIALLLESMGDSAAHWGNPERLLAVSAGQTGAAGASSEHGGRQVDAFDEIIHGDEEEDADIASSPAREVRRPRPLAGPRVVSRTPLQAAFQPGATKAGQLQPLLSCNYVKARGWTHESLSVTRYRGDV